jgi:tRNA nucleotidyltransferase (CCA-adding enzyme)
MKVPIILEKIAEKLKTKGAKAVIVGGAVRDYLLNSDIKDYDIEVFNINSLEELQKILSEFGSVNIVGKSFGVVKLKVNNIEYDFSLPRIEQKIDKGHKGFSVELKPFISFEQAAKRRDFTINAMGWDIIEKKLLDPYGGKKDLLTKTLQIVNENSFVEDPLRVYRAIQFAARFNLTLSLQTKEAILQIVKSGELNTLPKERIFSEFNKLLLKAKKPSIGLELLKELNLLDYFLELKQIIGVPQNPIYHSEGDVWIHTLMVVDEMAKLKPKNSKKALILMYGALTHDFGKAVTTKIINGKITSYRHEIAGVNLSESFLKRLTNNQELINEVKKLVRYHLVIPQFFKNGAKIGAIKRVATKINLKDLELLSRADFYGRANNRGKTFEAGEWILQKAKELNCLNNAPKPLLKGRDLINLGLKPSPKFGEILKKAYKAQLDNKFNTKDKALKWLKENLNNF